MFGPRRAGVLDAGLAEWFVNGASVGDDNREVRHRSERYPENRKSFKEMASEAWWDTHFEPNRLTIGVGGKFGIDAVLNSSKQQRIASVR